MMNPAWQGGFPIQSAALGHTYASGQHHEDWEDWLRWDPALEPASPEDETINSGSSKNHSPLQNTILPIQGKQFGKNETLAPPMVLGEDSLDFEGRSVLEEDSFLFGQGSEVAPSFDFQPLMTLEQAPFPMSKLDTSFPSWDLHAHNESLSVNLSAISNDNSHTIPSATTAPSTAPSMQYSPESTTQVRTSISSNSPDPPKKRGGRKRKAEVEPEPQDELGDSQEDGDGPPVKKASHNVIEKRYRTNLNDKIVELRSAVPALRAMGRANRGDATEDLEGLTPAHKLNKATIMAKATEYIKHLEKRNQTMADEMAALKARLASVETSIGNSRERQASMGQSAANSTTRPRHASSSSQNGANGFANPQQQQAIAQQQYMQAQQPPAYARQPGLPVDAQNHPQYVNGRGGGGMMNKIMLGTMAGVMVMEGFFESQNDDESSSRALFAPPIGMLNRGLGRTSTSPSSPAILSRDMMLPLLKLSLVMGVLIYLLFSLLPFSPRRKQKSRAAGVRLPHAPSLASPIEVRRKAWLTAIQTVWVPKHFLLEVVAVTSKMISLSIRQLIGSEAFNVLTGAVKDDEIARIKAWDIAIDAQLAGGDQEVSYYRLLLTLMESGTLPDSPTRLMQKAVHFRVFFWEVANAGYGNMVGFKQFTEKVGRRYWEMARRQQKELIHAKSQARTGLEPEEDAELLPDHLACLVELDCDDVLSDEMIQRAWNLAWNKPSAYRTINNGARDAVVEDHAIRSPMDAVAAWYANMVVDQTLAESLNKKASIMDMEYYAGLAVLVAPPASATLARTLTSKAVLSNSNRDTNIVAALNALPAASPNLCEINAVNHVPASPDIPTALTLAKLLSLTSLKSSSIAHERALSAIADLHIPPSSFTLLTAVAAYRLLQQLSSDTHLPVDTTYSLEDLAASLRIWIGTSGCRNAEIETGGCNEIVTLCLDLAKRAGGWDERDSGYGSAGYSPEVSPVREKPELAL